MQQRGISLPQSHWLGIICSADSETRKIVACGKQHDTCCSWLLKYNLSYCYEVGKLEAGAFL